MLSLEVSFVDIDIINALRLVLIRFFNKYNIDESLGIFHLKNKSSS